MIHADTKNNLSSSNEFDSKTSFEYIATSPAQNIAPNVRRDSISSANKIHTNTSKSNTSKSSSRQSVLRVPLPLDNSTATEPPMPFPRTTSKQRRDTQPSAAAIDTSKYDSQTEEIIQTILCSTTSNQSTISCATENTVNSSAPSLLDDLRHGIRLLDSLVESEKLNKATKKRLVKKIVKGLLRAKFSIGSGSTSSGDVSSAVNKSSTKTAPTPVKSQQSPQTERTTVDRSMQWLQPMTRSEVDFEKRQRSRPATRASIKLDWIQEEMAHLRSLQSCLLKQQKLKGRSQDPTYANNAMSEEYYCPVGVKIPRLSTSTYASTKDSTKASQIKYIRPQPIPVQDESSDSPVIIDRFVQNRTKLQTPNNDVSDTLGSYARSKQKRFLKQYQSGQDRLALDLIYARPYGHPYVEPQQTNRPPPTTVASNNSASTSSHTFISSGSISIPEMPYCSSPTKPPTMRRASIAIQTTDSLRRCPSNPTYAAPHPSPPPAPAISYTITYAQPTRLNAAPLATTTTTATPTTMQDHLQRRKPTFLANANARRECIAEMRRLRHERNVQRHKLFALLDDPAELRANLQLLQPPLPLTQRRVFTTRQLKEATRHRYERLPEIRAKEEAQKLGRIRNGQRVMRDVFSRDLQRRALRGRVNLSNSMTATGDTS